ncbi:MAG: hypothetical protein WC758_02975 [Candidatus Woesearchaeota archaeon]|jgi:hypothetical protein
MYENKKLSKTKIRETLILADLLTHHAVFGKIASEVIEYEN